MSSLTEQRVLVIGGSSGIGLATATAARNAGASVTIASRNREKLDAAAAGLNGAIVTAVLDSHDDGQIERFFGESEHWDHIVISAAQTKSGPVRILPLEDAKASMESKFWEPTVLLVLRR